MKKNRKILTIIVCLALVLTATVAGTLAMFIAEDADENTFVFGKVNISLTETATDDGDSDPTTNAYWMLEGKQEIAKDPTVTVLADSGDCWLFVQLEQSANFADYLSYDVASGWSELVNYPGVYFRRIVANGQDQVFSVLEGDKLTVNDISEQTLSLLTQADAPTLSVTAYALQLSGFDSAQDAWNAMSASISNP